MAGGRGIRWPGSISATAPRLERINWLGDPSAKGLAESFGLLVNYKYDAAMIERNHELYTNNGEVIMSSTVKALLPAAA